MIITQLNIGDIVTLKSGGRPMTVESVSEAQASLVRMDKLDRLRQDLLPVSALRFSLGEFDGIPDLIIEGLTHTAEEVAEYKRSRHNA